jgi:hypothetical protein
MSAKANTVAGNFQTSFGLPMTNFPLNQSLGGAGGSDGYNNSQQVYIDPELVKTQKNQSITMIDNQLAIARERAKAEYEAQKQAIAMKAEHDMSMATASIEQSKVQSLFALDQQFQQRRMEIEQRAQEQKLQIESTASQLLMTAEQQRLEKDMQEKMAKVYGSMPQSMQNGYLGNSQFSYAPSPSMSGTSTNLPFYHPSTYQPQQSQPTQYFHAKPQEEIKSARK